MKRPSFQFYPADWRKDPALSVCSLAARGFWIELMCIAHESVPYGTLSINGKPMTIAQLSRATGQSVATVKKLIGELEDAGVFSRDETGTIFSRRMVKDEHIRNVRSEAGNKGGNPNLLKQNSKISLSKIKANAQANSNPFRGEDEEEDETTPEGSSTGLVTSTDPGWEVGDGTHG